MKKKILLGSIIAMASLQALGGLTGIDNLSSSRLRARIIFQNGKTTEWAAFTANPKAIKNQPTFKSTRGDRRRGTKPVAWQETKYVFYNINSKNVKIQWYQYQPGITYTTETIGDARDLYIHNNGRYEIYEWNKSYSKANWHQALKN